METEQMSVKKHPSIYGFVHKSLEDISTAVEWARAISEGASLDDKYYLSIDGKIDYSEPNTGLILSVVSYGKELGIPPMQSLVSIIPQEGRYTIRGDQAKAMIFASGLVKDWKESVEGDIDNGTFKYIITATNDDGVTLTREYGVRDAKRADLWVTQAKLNGPYGARYRQSPWFRYPKRMCMYRALGFLARDLFPEVMKGLVISEEVGDYPDLTAVTVSTRSGAEVTLQNRTGKEHKVEQEAQHIKQKLERRDRELNVDQSNQEAVAAKQEMENLRDQHVADQEDISKEQDPIKDQRMDAADVEKARENIDKSAQEYNQEPEERLKELLPQLRKMDEGVRFTGVLPTGSKIHTNYSDREYIVESVNISRMLYDPKTQEDLWLPPEYTNYDLVCYDPENKANKYYLNEYVVFGGRIVHILNNDEIIILSKGRGKKPQEDQGVPPPKELDSSEDTKKYPMTLEEAYPAGKVYTEKELLRMGREIYSLAEELGVKEQIDALPGKKTNKKYRSFILEHQKERGEEHAQAERKAHVTGGGGPPAATEKDVNPPQAPQGDALPLEENGQDEKQPPQEEAPHPQPGEEEPPEERDESREHFQAMDEELINNKYNIHVPEIHEGEDVRDFQDARKLAFELTDIGIDNNGWTRLASQLIYNQQKGLTYLAVYKTKENFCKKAPAVDINYLIGHHVE